MNKYHHSDSPTAMRGLLPMVAYQRSDVSSGGPISGRAECDEVRASTVDRA